MAALQVTPVGPAGLKAAGGDAAGGERLAVMRLAVKAAGGEGGWLRT
jgi:hypothetical protein